MFLVGREIYIFVRAKSRLYPIYNFDTQTWKYRCIVAENDRMVSFIELRHLHFGDFQVPQPPPSARRVGSYVLLVRLLPNPQKNLLPRAIAYKTDAAAAPSSNRFAVRYFVTYAGRFNFASLDSGHDGVRPMAIHKPNKYGNHPGVKIDPWQQCLLIF